LREIDINKLLEKNGFVKIRDRSSSSQELVSDGEDSDENAADGGSKVPRGAASKIQCYA